MARAAWPLVQGRPAIEVALVSPGNGRQAVRTLLADTGAGSAGSLLELILSEADCRQFSAGNAGTRRLGGAFTGIFPAFWVCLSIPGLGFTELCFAVAIRSSLLPRPLQGIACFRFLNRFAYGNFGDHDRFGLETP
jgi:hypothetical protein